MVLKAVMAVIFLAPLIQFAQGGDPQVQTLDTQLKALKAITEAAAEICNTVDKEGSNQNLELSGDVKAKLGGLVAKITDLGIEGAGKYSSGQYKNVLQRDLAKTLQHNTDCRHDVFKVLQEKMIGSIVPNQSPLLLNPPGDIGEKRAPNATRIVPNPQYALQGSPKFLKTPSPEELSVQMIADSMSDCTTIAQQNRKNSHFLIVPLEPTARALTNVIFSKADTVIDGKIGVLDCSDVFEFVKKSVLQPYSRPYSLTVYDGQHEVSYAFDPVHGPRVHSLAGAVKSLGWYTLGITLHNGNTKWLNEGDLYYEAPKLPACEMFYIAIAD